MKRFLAPLLAAVFTCASAMADGVPPATVEVGEKEPGLFLVRWKVPAQLPPGASPELVLPDSFTPVGERVVLERPGAWFVRQAYRSAEGLSGELLGVEYPFLNVSVSTLLRVELLTGERHAHLFAPGEAAWRVPESTAGRAPARWRAARDGVLEGARHFVGNPLHLVLLLSLLLLGNTAAFRLATVFTAGQLGAVAVHSITGLGLAPAFGEIGLAVAAALLAREALRPAEERRQLAGLAAAAGLTHGLAIGGAGFLHGALVVLGLDAALVLSLAVLAPLGLLVSRPLAPAPLRAIATYLVAGSAIALACAAPLPGSSTIASETSTALRLPELSVPGASVGARSSRRLAARVPDAPLQSFVSVAPFEVRHEVLVRLRDLAEPLGLDPSGVLEVERQAEVARRVGELVTTRTALEIDQAPGASSAQRVDFLTLDARTGALPRPSPVPEAVDSAWVGVTASYPTETTPQNLALVWTAFDLAATVPATVTDPESSTTLDLSQNQALIGWTNELVDDPAPVVRATEVEPATLWVPLGSLALLGALAVFALVAARGRRRWLSIALARPMLAGACLVAPLASLAWALPLSSQATPELAEARRILAGLLPNVYRAFEFPTESAVYDRLALSVTGETLSKVFIEQRRAVEMEERGGARAHVETVEVVAVDTVESAQLGGFVATAAWTVGGTVTHFGHRHFRQNRYDARVTLVPDAGSWKLEALEVLDERRLR